MIAVYQKQKPRPLVATNGRGSGRPAGVTPLVQLRWPALRSTPDAAYQPTENLEVPLMQRHPNATVQASTVPDENEATLVETIDGLMIAPRWLADLLDRVTDRGLTRIRANHFPAPKQPTLWDQS